MAIQTATAVNEDSVMDGAGEPMPHGESAGVVHDHVVISRPPVGDGSGLDGLHDAWFEHKRDGTPKSAWRVDTLVEIEALARRCTPTMVRLALEIDDAIWAVCRVAVTAPGETPGDLSDARDLVGSVYDGALRNAIEFPGEKCAHARDVFFGAVGLPEDRCDESGVDALLALLDRADQVVERFHSGCGCSVTIPSTYVADFRAAIVEEIADTACGAQEQRGELLDLTWGWDVSASIASDDLDSAMLTLHAAARLLADVGACGTEDVELDIDANGTLAAVFEAMARIVEQQLARALDCTPLDGGSADRVRALTAELSWALDKTGECYAEFERSRALSAA